MAARALDAIAGAQHWSGEQSGRVLSVFFDNPPRNLLNAVAVDELYALVRALERDRSVGAVVVTGKPDDLFVTHYDTEELVAAAEGVGVSLSPGQARAVARFTWYASRVPGLHAALRRSPAKHTLSVQRLDETFRRMNRLDKVFVAAVNGMALGGGCLLALACDIRLMADADFPIGLPEITMGLVAGLGGTQRLPRLVGTGRALELLLEGRPVPAREAADIGLVNGVVSPDELLGEAETTAQRMARRAPLAVEGAKRLVYDGSARPLSASILWEEAPTFASGSQPGAVEAMKSYTEALRARDPRTHEEVLALWKPLFEGSVTTDKLEVA